jgi:hypothetical protein
MKETSTVTLSVVIKRQMLHPPEKNWRALTQPQLIGNPMIKNQLN